MYVDILLIRRDNESETIEITRVCDKIYRSYRPSLNNGPTTSTCLSNYNSNTTILPTYCTPHLGDRTKYSIPTQLGYKGKRWLFHERVIIGENNPEAVMVERKGTMDTSIPS